MDSMTQEICATTQRFYAQNAAAFSGTRQQPWEGWERLAATLSQLPAHPTVLDVACGNLRFERFLDAQGIRPARVFALDACAELLNSTAPEGMTVEHIQTDIMDVLDAPTGFESFGIPSCNLTVAFGFMHHLPSPLLREKLMEQLLTATAPRGLCIISFWQFGKDERLTAKAKRATAQAEQTLGITFEDERDHFLGWQDAEETFRFCHDFSDAEIDELKRFAEERDFLTVNNFTADGKSGNLNRYLVLRRL